MQLDSSIKALQMPHDSHMSLPQAALSPPTSDVANESIGMVFVRVVVQRRKLFYLVTVRATDRDSVASIAERLHDVRDHLLGYRWLLKPLHDVVWGYRIALVTLSTFRTIGASELHAPLEVNVRARDSCPEMNRPSLLDDTESFAAVYPQVLQGNLARQALLIERKLNKHNVLLCGIVAIFVAILAGVLVGVSTSSIAYGFATTAGTVGTVGFLIPLSTWAAG